MGVTAQFAPGPASAAALNVSSLPVVTATADIIAPFEGQVIHNTTDNMLYRYEGSIWIAFLAMGTTLHEARYEQRASGQSVPTATDTKMKFEAVNTSCADVTASGTNNTDFLLNRGGLWRISAGVRYLGNASGGNERHLFIQTGSTFVPGNRLAINTQFVSTNIPAGLNVSTEVRLFANTTIIIGIWQNAGSNTVVDTGFGGVNHIALAWLRP